MNVSYLTAQPLRTPLLLAGSILVLGGIIAANALLLQPRPHPAPLVVTRNVAEPDVQRSDDLVLAVQSVLQQHGYYSGALDGVAGPRTEAAILAFEAASGRAGSGLARFELLAELRAMSVEGATSLSDPAAGRDALTFDDRVAAVQRALAISGYGPLGADGILGSETREAIANFQRDHGLPPTGEISDALIVELRAAGALQDN